MVQVYTKPVYCTSVHKTSSLCKCTQNQFTVQVYTKPVYWLIMKGMYIDRTILWNVHGWNMTKDKAVQTMHKMCTNCVLTMCKVCANCEQAVCKLCANCEQAVCKLCQNWLALCSLNKSKVAN